jgi:hypothetical protein
MPHNIYEATTMCKQQQKKRTGRVASICSDRAARRALARPGCLVSIYLEDAGFIHSYSGIPCIYYLGCTFIVYI